MSALLLGQCNKFDDFSGVWRRSILSRQIWEMNQAQFKYTFSSFFSFYIYFPLVGNSSYSDIMRWFLMELNVNSWNWYSNCTLHRICMKKLVKWQYQWQIYSRKMMNEVIQKHYDILKVIMGNPKEHLYSSSIATKDQWVRKNRIIYEKSYWQSQFRIET